MTHRTLTVLGSCLAIASLAPVAAGQTTSGAETGVGGLLAPADGVPVPMTPWGDPDFQGVWNNSTSTPIEDRTEEERAQGRQAQAAVIEATSGTGAGWIERAGGLDRKLADRRSAKRENSAATARGDPASGEA